MSNRAKTLIVVSAVAVLLLAATTIPGGRGIKTNSVTLIPLEFGTVPGSCEEGTLVFTKPDGLCVCQEQFGLYKWQRADGTNPCEEAPMVGT